MAKKKKKKKKSSNHKPEKAVNAVSPKETNAGKTTTAASQPVASEISPSEKKLEALEKSAVEHAVEEDIQAAGSASPPEKGTTAAELIERASYVLELLESQRTRTESAEAEAQDRMTDMEEERQRLSGDQDRLDEREAQLNTRDTELSRQEQRLSERETALNSRTTGLNNRERELNSREESLVQRELDADVGFSQRNATALAQLQEESERLRERFAHHQQQLAQERNAWDDELSGAREAWRMEQAERREKCREELNSMRRDCEAELEALRRTAEEELSEVREKLKEEQLKLKEEKRLFLREKCKLEVDSELFQEKTESFDKKVEGFAAKAIEERDAIIQELKERLKAARSARDGAEGVLRVREEADRRFGNRTPEQVLEEMRALQSERDELRSELGKRPDVDAVQRLEELTGKHEALEQDNFTLRRQLAEQKRLNSLQDIAVTELEDLRNVKLSLESGRDILREANRQLRTEVVDLVKSSEGGSPFPSCSGMDNSSELQTPPPRLSRNLSLKQFAEEMRHRMASAPQKALYYSAEDVRSFLGGLSMSRLHLLQGISGTGKTSLPLAFADAMDGDSALIEVQAGWRDRQDLIGHFNSFEKRFYESEFLQALYKAGTPLFKDRPFIIVLDEMNLSHPEQYFADLLSALEQNPEHQRLTLMSAPVKEAPLQLVDQGKKLKVPQNVWFVGTANHDETTRDFADKTYDRAHVMELPRHKETFEAIRHPYKAPISMDALRQAFDNAKNRHEKQSKQAYRFLQESFADPLAKRFRVGWGNRLERQMNDYIPVVMDAGGTVGEAMDHILATKLLRKIRDRHDNRPQDILELRETIQLEWSKLDSESDAKRSIELLTLELQRLGHDDD
jgi:hypothetical protein